MGVEFTDNTASVLAAMRNQAEAALEKCGATAEGYAQDLAPVDTGNLRNRISHVVDGGDNRVYVGTNVDYALYVEMGTGIYAAGGRPTPWAYQDSKGNWHWTHGQRAQPFVKPAIADHAGTYQTIIDSEMRK